MPRPGEKRDAAEASLPSDTDSRPKKKTCSTAQDSNGTDVVSVARTCVKCGKIGHYMSEVEPESFSCVRCHRHNKIGEDGHGMHARLTASDDELASRMELYETGRAYDVTVITEDGALRAHRSVLGVRSSFFRRAFERTPRAEAISFRIIEGSLVTDTVLRHIYRLPLKWIDTYCPNEDVLQIQLINLVALRNTAAKFDLADLIKIAEDAFEERLPALTACKLTDLGARVFVMTDCSSILHIMASTTVAHMPHILADENAWYNLYSTEAYSKEVLKLAHHG